MRKSVLPVLALMVLGAFALIPFQYAHATGLAVHSSIQGGWNPGGNGVPFPPQPALISLTVGTATTSQIIVIWTAINTGNTGLLTAIYDNQSNFFSLNIGGGAAGTTCGQEPNCVWGAALSNTVVDTGHDRITLSFSNQVPIISVAIYDVTGAAIKFDVQGPGYSNTGFSLMASQTLTPVAGSIVVTEAYVHTNTGTFTAGASYTLAGGQTVYPTGAYWATSEYIVLGGGSTSPTETSSANEGWFMVGMAFEPVGSLVTQPINVGVANYGVVTLIGISGCNVGNSSFRMDGYTHSFTGLVPSCNLIVTVPPISVAAFARWLFANSAGHGRTTWTVPTPASGTGSTATNTTYYQIKNHFSMTAISIPWDAVYSEPVLGTFLGVGSVTLGTISLNSSAGSGGTWVWSDFNQIVALPLSFAATGAYGGSWNNATQALRSPALEAESYDTEYLLVGGSVVVTVTQTIVGINAPSPAAFGNAVGPEIIPLFILGLGMFIVYVFRMRGDFGVTVMLGFFFAGNLIGMLHNGNGTLNVGVVPLAMTAESGIFFVMWIAAGGATSSR